MADSIDKWAKKKTWKEKSEEWRAKIKVSQTLNRLQAFANGEPDPQTGEPVDMSPAQVKAASILLNKAMPDLSQADIHNTQEGPRLTYDDLIAKLSDSIGKDNAELLLKSLGQTKPEVSH